MSESAEGALIPERFVPDEMRGQLVAAEHIARYTWARPFCEGKRVLDAGCGSGYGSALIAEAGAAEVIAVDRSETALELARAAVPTAVTCELGDVVELRFADDTFDVVVCFEVLEHVEQQARVLDEFARVLRPGGLLFVSSPNRERYVPGNPHHVHEFTRGELGSMLGARFAQSRIYSQHVMLASAVTSPEVSGFADVHTVRSDAPRSEDEVYLLGMAGDVLPADPAPVVSLGHFTEAREWLTYIGAQRDHIKWQERRIAGLEDLEAERTEALDQVSVGQSRQALLTASMFEAEQLRQELATAVERLGAIDEELEALRTTLQSCSTELSQARQTVANMASSKSWTITKPLRRVVELGRSTPRQP